MSEIAVELGGYSVVNFSISNIISKDISIKTIK